MTQRGTSDDLDESQWSEESDEHDTELSPFVAHRRQAEDGVAAPSVFIQHGLRNEANFSGPIKGPVTLVGKENIINICTETQKFQIKVSSKHRDVEAVVAINMVSPDDGNEPAQTLSLGGETRQQITLGKELLVHIESEDYPIRRIRARTRSILRTLFNQVNMIIDYFHTGSIIIGLQPKTEWVLFTFLNAIDGGFIQEMVRGILENEFDWNLDDRSDEPIKMKIDVNVPKKMFPSEFSCKRFASKKDMLEELNITTQREKPEETDKILKDKHLTMSSFPTCQVCHQQFSLKGPTPFLLPCLHSVCETCVTAAAGGVISCSPCQRDVNLTETPLQKDVVREKEILHLTVKHHPEWVLCTHEEDGNQAVCWCKECEDFFCENCQMTHNSFRGTKKHAVKDVREMEPGNLNELKYCAVHPLYILDTWDESCCTLICSKCKVAEHAEHKTADLDEAAKTAREEIVSYQQEARSTADQHKARLTTTEQDLRSSDESCDVLTGSIGNTFSTVRSLIDQREKELQITLQNHKETVREDLTGKKNTSETLHRRCLTTSHYIDKALQFVSPHDILELRPMLEEKYRDCRSSAPSGDYKVLPLPVFNTEGLEKIKSTLAHIGGVSTEGLHINNTKDSGTQTEEDVVEELENVQQELRLSEIKSISQTKDLGAQIVKLKQELDDLKASEERLDRQKKEAEKRLREDVLHQSFLLSRTDIEFSKKKYNAKMVHINAEGKLINKAEDNPPYSDQRLEKYTGTSSTVPLPQCGSPQYFEVKSRVGIDKTLTENNLLLEIGLVREEEQDQYHCIGDRPHSYSLTVARCTTHSSICRKVWRHGKYIKCLSATLENTPGTSATLHYGVVYDSARSRIAFLDVENKQIIGKIDNVDSSVALLPMFGVYNRALATVSMSLIVGSDIAMSESKKTLIINSLS